MIMTVLEKILIFRVFKHIVYENSAKKGQFL